jgi:hypothetical protein
MLSIEASFGGDVSSINDAAVGPFLPVEAMGGKPTHMCGFSTIVSLYGLDPAVLAHPQRCGLRRPD